MSGDVLIKAKKLPAKLLITQMTILKSFECLRKSRDQEMFSILSEIKLVTSCKKFNQKQTHTFFFLSKLNNKYLNNWCPGRLVFVVDFL